MPTLAAIEADIKKLPPAKRVQLVRWIEEQYDPDEGLEIRPEYARKLDAAWKQIQRGEVGNWEKLKQRVKAKPA